MTAFKFRMKRTSRDGDLDITVFVAKGTQQTYQNAGSLRLSLAEYERFRELVYVGGKRCGQPIAFDGDVHDSGIIPGEPLSWSVIENRARDIF